MIDVVVVKSLDSNIIYYVSPNGIDLHVGDNIIFDSESGLIFGVVLKSTYKESRKRLDLPLFNVIRIASSDDEKLLKKHIKMNEKALKSAKKISKELNLNMNFVDSFINFDESRLTFSFLAEERIDFRDLVKKLAQMFKTRIELRQIGVRDKAKKIGGLGPCGLFLCCNSFLTDFNSVSINMAKNQLLALNPSKINGICGRLLCCLGYENDNYYYLKKSLPKLGSIINTEEGVGKVIELDVFRNTYSVDLGDKGIIKCFGDSRDD